MVRSRSIIGAYSRFAFLCGIASYFSLYTAFAATVDVSVQDRNGPLAQIVVLLDAITGEANKASSPDAAVVDQLHQQFVPGVIAVRTGTAISFPNSDSVSHQVYSFSPAKRFELGLYRGVPRDPVVFDKPGIVVLGCNIHDNMIGYVYVTDAQYFGTTDSQGHFAVDIAPGKYRVHVWSPRFSKVENASERTVEVKDAHVSLPIQVANPVRATNTEPEARRLRDY